MTEQKELGACDRSSVGWTAVLFPVTVSVMRGVRCQGVYLILIAHCNKKYIFGNAWLKQSLLDD
jgi:hypothetical protein